MKLLQGASKHLDYPGNFPAVEFHLGVAVRHPVDRLVFFQPVLLEREPLDQLIQLGAQDERDIPDAEEAAALRAVDLLVGLVGKAIDHKLPLAAGALEDFRDHGVDSSVPAAGPARVPLFGDGPRRSPSARVRYRQERISSPRPAGAGPEKLDSRRRRSMQTDNVRTVLQQLIRI